MIAWLERKIGWIAFPSIIRYLALFQLGMVGLTFVNPKAVQLIKFNWPAILEGEYWRIFSFIFVPIGQSNLNDANGSIVALFAVFAALIMMQFSDGIESRLGAFRTTLYFLGGWVACSLSSIFFSISPLGLLGTTPEGVAYTVVNILPPGMLFDASILFIFATFHPKFTLLLFFVLPVQIWILATVTALLIALDVYQTSSLGALLHFCIALSHYLILAASLLKKRKALSPPKKIIQIKVPTAPKERSFHTCDVCGIKDTDDPSMGFRVTSKGQVLCMNCLKDTKKD